MMLELLWLAKGASHDKVMLNSEEINSTAIAIFELKVLTSACKSVSQWKILLNKKILNFISLRGRVYGIFLSLAIHNQYYLGVKK